MAVAERVTDRPAFLFVVAVKRRAFLRCPCYLSTLNSEYVMFGTHRAENSRHSSVAVRIVHLLTCAHCPRAVPGSYSGHDGGGVESPLFGLVLLHYRDPTH